MTDKYKDMREHVERYMYEGSKYHLTKLDHWVAMLLNEVDQLREMVEAQEEDFANLHDEFDEAISRNLKLKERIRFFEEYGIHSNAMKEIERLKKSLEEIAKAEPLSITHDINYMQHIARKALEGTQGSDDEIDIPPIKFVDRIGEDTECSP